MDIVCVKLDERHWSFRVYAHGGLPDERFVSLLAHLQHAGLTFTLCGTADDPRRALTIGPLDEERALVFAAEWMPDARDSALDALCTGMSSAI